MSQSTTPPDSEIDLLLTDPEARAWFEKHLTQLREDAYGQRILFWTLAAAFVVGLIAYVVGYLLKSSAPEEPVGLLADMVYTLGFALWTAVVVVVLVEVIPDVKRGQIRRSLEAYEAIRRDKSKKGTSVTEQP
ncbi:MAG TPA: hypothetical protein VGQ31_10025 [Candidatus Limnocylindrales bacterium]|jgi:hypothetical protein|nr:hypothetical protein [Candidatus Limnocylindrales bacterium]